MFQNYNGKDVDFYLENKPKLKEKTKGAVYSCVIHPFYFWEITDLCCFAIEYYFSNFQLKHYFF